MKYVVAVLTLVVLAGAGVYLLHRRGSDEPAPPIARPQDSEREVPGVARDGARTKEAESLAERVKAGEPDAILAAGRRGMRSMIPVLKGLARQPDRTFGGAAASAQMALARLGEKEQQTEILAELKSEDPSEQDNAVEKLVYVGNHGAVRALAKLLEDNEYRSRPPPLADLPRQDRELFEPLSHLATGALARLVPDGPVESGDRPESAGVETWKQWWNENKARYADD